jgi:hypothetical protein
MACKHKFQKNLNLEILDFTPTTLVVGTFNPAWPASNTAEWFYGRTATNYFWDILPKLYGSESLINATPVEWKRFCHDKQIAITDLFSSIDDADPDNPEHNKMLGGFSDSAIIYNFDDIDYVNIVQLLRSHTSIKNVYLTRGVTEAFWRHLWNPVAHFCNHNNIHEAKLLTPTSEASYQHDAYNIQNPEDQIPFLADYILTRWRQEWHF